MSREPNPRSPEETRVANGEDSKIPAYVVAVVAGLVGAGGSTGVQMLTPEVRSDPFTGTMGREMESRIVRRIEEMDNRHTREIAHMDERIDATVGIVAAQQRDMHNQEINCERWRGQIEARILTLEKPGSDAR